MIVKFAKSISLLFNPVVVLVVIPFLLVYRTTDIYSAFMWTLYTVMYLLAITVFILFSVQRKIFTDFDVSRREQRPLIFAVSLGIALLYLGGLYIFRGPAILFLMAYGTILGILLASIANRYLKVSIHVSTVSALLIAIAFVYDTTLSRLSLLLIPLVAWSRIKIKRHTFRETIAGAVLGVTIAVFILIFLKVVLKIT